MSSRFLNLALLWCFEKKNVLVESWKFMSNFSTLSIRGCWGQPILLFWKLVHKTQISKLPEPTRHHNSIRLWILLSLRADLLYILQYETPCINNISHSSRNYFWEVLKKMSNEYVNKICQEFQFIWMTWMCHVNMKNEGEKLTIMESMYAHKILLNGFFLQRRC